MSSGIPVTGTLKPTSELDTYPVTTEVYHKGGYRAVADSTERLAIPAARRKLGMLVKEVSSGYYYTLSGGIANENWTIETFGGNTSNTTIGTLTLVNGDLW